MNVLDSKILRTTGKWRVLYDIMAASRCSDVIALRWWICSFSKVTFFLDNKIF